MKVHHLNCGSMVGGLVDHCLLVEADRFLVLVDTGYGLDCVRQPAQWLGWTRHVVRPRLAESETAVRQVAALGFDPTDVRHILLTHLDYDHTGGLADFPWATVHVHEPEFRAAMRPDFVGRIRYQPRHWAHGPKWELNSVAGGDNWFGFESVRELPGLPSEFLVVPLIGHSRGHAGVAVDTGDGWLLDAGDSYWSDDEIGPAPSRFDLGALARVPMAALPSVYRANIARLAELRRTHGGEVTMFSVHDAAAYHRLR
ncbi:MBL fold metallo-hydrolase [Nocardia arthritidis]|uniref:MBL fold metallo-hydrolase n=1 Tax=Nocardia arthritidis TaxID=228602 RepID=A0A6G9Y975_9NOCA|nr:MBL fold metallo-hydrolase [Nocardia arthritidis]